MWAAPVRHIARMAAELLLLQGLPDLLTAGPICTSARSPDIDLSASTDLLLRPCCRLPKPFTELIVKLAIACKILLLLSLLFLVSCCQS